jgi:hypothetical protein
VLTASCLSPCHGFGGIVEQWKTSRHYSTYIANLGGEEVDTWTGAKSCGNCHAIDAIQLRVEGDIGFKGTTGPVNGARGQLNYADSTAAGKITETYYAGDATVAAVHCTTCHEASEENDPHLTGEEWEPGSFPLRVPSGSTDEAIIEKSSAVGVSDGTSAGAYGAGNACIWCHKSRKDVTNYITASTSVTSTSWGPHNGPHADIYTGTGGYQYSGKTYTNGSHSNFENGCVRCHMPEVEYGDAVMPNHSFYAQLSVCTAACHVNDTDFDVNGGQSKVKNGLQRLRETLNTAGYLTQDGTGPLTAEQLADEEFELDDARPQTAAVPAANAGALYNYLVVTRGAALGVHNPDYTGQLIYDSIEALGGDLSLIVRP